VEVAIEGAEAMEAVAEAIAEEMVATEEVVEAVVIEEVVPTEAVAVMGQPIELMVAIEAVGTGTPVTEPSKRWSTRR
jgi:hypothetical protein